MWWNKAAAFIAVFSIITDYVFIISCLTCLSFCVNASAVWINVNYMLTFWPLLYWAKWENTSVYNTFKLLFGANLHWNTTFFIVAKALTNPCVKMQGLKESTVPRKKLYLRLRYGFLLRHLCGMSRLCLIWWLSEVVNCISGMARHLQAIASSWDPSFAIW